MPRTRRILPLAVLLAAAALPGPALAAAVPAPVAVARVGLLPTGTTVTAGDAVRRTCSDRPLAAGTAGAVVRQVTTGVDSYLDVRLGGSPTGADWDLAVFDRLTGKLLGASAAFGGNEIVQAPVEAGTALTIQACHISGSDDPVALSAVQGVLEGALPKPETESLVRIPLHSQAQANELQAAGIDLAETSRGPYVDAVMHGADDVQRVRDLGFDATVRVPDLAEYDREVLRSDALTAGRAGITALPSGRTTYRQLADYQQDLKNLVAAHPGVVRPFTLPHLSVQGRTVEGVEIATDVNRTDDGRPVVLQLGLHHVREWPSGEVTIEAALDLFKADDAADGARKQRILDGVRQYFVPVVNPDGLVATQLNGADDPLADQPDATLGMSAAGTGAYRRKNCSNGIDGTAPVGVPCSALPGVDLNRNYGAFWGGPGESDNPAMGTFRGPSPFSEPEVKNIHELSSGLQVMIVNSNHTFAGDVLFQPGFHRTDEPGLKTTDKVPYQDAMKALSDKIATAAGYASFVSYDLYDVTGATEDWNYFAQGAFGYTTEVSYDNFHPNYQDGVIDQFTGTIKGSLNVAAKRKPSQGLRESMLLTAEAALDPAQHATLTGTAPPGRVLRLQKTFMTSTSFVETQTDTVDVAGAAQLLPEKLDTKLTVPASGSYSWAIDPSTRPVELLAGRTEAWTMTCEDAAGKVYETRQVTIGIGKQQTQSFACRDGGSSPATDTSPVAPSTPGTPGSGAPAGPAGPGQVTTTPVPGSPAAGGHRVAISRPAFSAKRTKRVGSVQVRLRLVGGGKLTKVRIRILGRGGRTLFAARLASLTGSRNVRVKPVGRLRKLTTGKVTVVVTAIDGGRAIRLTKRSVVKR